MIYYISDLHFYHSNIIKLSNRPFESIKGMNELLINNWNKTVTNSDIVYFLGDFSFKCNPNQADKILEKLNGKKYFIKGNHDKETWLNRIKEKGLIEDWFDYKDLDDNGRRVILFHYPIHSWNGLYRGSYHLYGHVHNNTVDNQEWQKNRFNVSCEVLNYTPKTLDQLIEERDKKEKEYKDLIDNYKIKFYDEIGIPGKYRKLLTEEELNKPISEKIINKFRDRLSKATAVYVHTDISANDLDIKNKF